MTRAGRAVELTKTEVKLPCELAAERGRVLSREELLERVWGYDFFGDAGHDALPSPTATGRHVSTGSSRNRHRRGAPV